MSSIVWLALLFPLLGFLYCAVIGWRGAPNGRAPVGEGAAVHPGSGIVASAAIGLSFVVALGVLVDLLGRPADQRFIDVPLWTWIASGDLVVKAGLLVDPLSALMLVIVTGVGFLIHVYATGYMRGDPGYSRFFAYMNLFVLAMLTLVLADNFLLLMVGWGGVGLCSYLLIAFWFERPEAARAGVKAFVVNSIGDVGLMVAVFLLFTTFKSLDYDTVFRGVAGLGAENGTLTAIALLLLVGAAAKSAQLPLYVWLPDAMAGPTPVSALIHAATMVTAGVYLIARAYPIYEASPVAMSVVAGIGAVTAIFAATAALVKPNIKRVLAYSTVSQLGYMFLGVGVGGFSAAMFHLTDHAFFKALLFLAAGGVIHALGGEEDLRKMGGLRHRLPTVYWTFLVGAAALAGVPLLSGFFSKDEIIFAAFTSSRGNTLLGVVALVTAGLTALYAFRVFFMAFHGVPRAANGGVAHLHQPGRAMTIPLVVLAVLAALAGYVQVPTLGFDSFLAPVFARYGAPELVRTAFDGTYWTVSIVSILMTLGGIGAAYLLYATESPLADRLVYQLSGLHQLFLNDYYVERLYASAIIAPLRWLARAFAGAVDGFVDGIVVGVGQAVRGASGLLAGLETGYVRNYALAILVGTVAVLAYLVGIAPATGVTP